MSSVVATFQDEEQHVGTLAEPADPGGHYENTSKTKGVLDHSVENSNRSGFQLGPPEAVVGSKHDRMYWQMNL